MLSTETNVELFYDDYVFMDIAETNLISIVHLLCLVHLHILFVVDACLHVMYGDLIRMVGFVVAADTATVASAGATAAMPAWLLLHLRWWMWGLMHLR